MSTYLLIQEFSIHEYMSDILLDFAVLEICDSSSNFKDIDIISQHSNGKNEDRVAHECETARCHISQPVKWYWNCSLEMMC